MAFHIGQKVRVKQDYPYIHYYRGKEYTIEGENQTAYGLYYKMLGVSASSAEFKQDIVSVLSFMEEWLEPLDDAPDHCKHCDALTPGRMICCDCKSEGKV